ncbi:diguanylate cyclase (GGDEF)-like protein [Paraburkholderia sp. GAS42]
MLCLLIGLLYLALEIRTIFSDQMKQEYAGLVLEAAQRAEGARNRVGVWQQLSDGDVAKPEGYRQARADLAAHLASLAALVNASPFDAPRIPGWVVLPDASLQNTDALLNQALTYWTAQRDRDSADVRTRIFRVAAVLIALAALVSGILITALAMYTKRTLHLAGQSQKFEHAATHDAMTGLPNRRKLIDTLEEAVAWSAAEPVRRKIAVLYVDLDGFKRVNDSLGHHAGDEFLVAVSRRFRQSVRRTDVVARIGGDEFAVLVREFSTHAELGEIARRLIACVTEVDAQMGNGLVRASIGIASFPDPVNDYHRLLAAADETMYQVKRNGKNGYAFTVRGN